MTENGPPAPRSMTNEIPGKSSSRLLAALIAVVAGIAGIAIWTTQGVPAAPGGAAGAPTSATSSVGSHAGKSAEPHRRARQTSAATVAASGALSTSASAPLAKIYDGLKARADSGDAAAASELFRDVHRCLRARDRLATLPRIVNHYLDADTSKLNAGELSEREQSLATLEQQLASARADNELCGDLTQAQLALPPAALQAAQLGDVTAANCYVGGALLYDRGLLDHPEWLTEYKANALTLAQSGISQGSWIMVSQLQNAYAQTFTSGFLAQLTGADPMQSYRYLKLRRLGANDKMAERLDSELAYAAQGLTASDISNGDAWAQDTYQRYFSANPVFNTNIARGGACEEEVR
jgi:hypothetical protein